MDKKQFLPTLKRVFQTIIQAPESTSYQDIRRMSAAQIQEIFEELDVEIRGSEHLPYEQNAIFIYNHLDNHPSLLVADDFQITLDSHFISSMLYKYYKNPGTRVARHSLPYEKSHSGYYDKFNYIRVWAKGFIPDFLSKQDIKTENRKFYSKAQDVLNSNIGLVFSPEGSSHETKDSPGPFNNGIFKLACGLKVEPKIVPLVMANFDMLPHETTYKCQIMPPFKMSDYGITDSNDPELPDVVAKINNQYKAWVKELCLEDKNFEREIITLKKRIDQKKNKEDLVVFYGSSTIRLWSQLETDLPEYNTLNLGFGGAFIHSLTHYFDTLFEDLRPKVIFLYLGGNDLTLGFSADKIISEISSFIAMIHEKFPETVIYNISIKPSFERKKDLMVIEDINSGVTQLANTLPHFNQLGLYEHLIGQDNQIIKEVFLQDGLHLNALGYKLLKKLALEALEKSPV